MKTKPFFIIPLFAVALTAIGCINNNNKDDGNRDQESDYEQQAPTSNKTSDDMEAAVDSAGTGDTIVPANGSSTRQ